MKKLNQRTPPYVGLVFWCKKCCTEWELEADDFKYIEITMTNPQGEALGIDVHCPICDNATYISMTMPRITR